MTYSEVNGADRKSANVLASEQMAPRGQLVFTVGVGALVFVPVFKAVTGLPPYLGMLFGLGVLWILTDAIHCGDSGRQNLKVPQALSRIDSQGILFILGILLSVGRYLSIFAYFMGFEVHFNMRLQIICYNNIFIVAYY